MKLFFTAFTFLLSVSTYAMNFTECENLNIALAIQQETEPAQFSIILFPLPSGVPIMLSVTKSDEKQTVI